VQGRPDQVSGQSPPPQGKPDRSPDRGLLGQWLRSIVDADGSNPFHIIFNSNNLGSVSLNHPSEIVIVVTA